MQHKTVCLTGPRPGPVAPCSMRPASASLPLHSLTPQSNRSNNRVGRLKLKQRPIPNLEVPPVHSPPLVTNFGLPGTNYGGSHKSLGV